MRNAYKILVGKCEYKRKWYNNFNEAGCEWWTGFIWLRIGARWALVKSVKNLRVP
jgi:hypothetical protein